MHTRRFVLFILVVQILLGFGDAFAANANTAFENTQPQVASFPFSDDFESGIGSTWVVHTLNGVVETNTDYHYSGTKSVFLGQRIAGAISVSLVLPIDLTGQTEDVFLDFWALRVGSPGFPTTTGVFISADEGVTWKKVLGLSNTAQKFSHHLINITSADLPLNNKFRIRFTYDITSSNLNSGLIIDDVRLTTQANEFATFPYTQGSFETEAFGQGLYPQSWGEGVVEFNTDYHHTGNRSVFLGQKEAGAVSASLVMAIDLTGQTDVFLDFWVLRVGNPGYGPTTGVFISADEGTNWEQILELSNTAQSFSHHVLNIVSAANTYNLSLNNKFRIRFTYDITSSNLNSGLIIDDIRLTTQANEFATFPYLHDDFETVPFRQGLYPQSWFNGRVDFNTDYQHSGSTSVFLGQKVPGPVSASLVMAVDLTGQPDVLLDFWVRRVGNPGYHLSTGVFISNDEGVNWKQILKLSDASQSFSHQTLDIVSAAATHNLTLNNKFRIRFTYDISNNSANDGIIIDDLKLIKTSISGKVYNEEAVSGNEVSGAFVQICNTTNSCQTTTSQGDGSYQFGDLPAGTYNLRVLPPAGNNHLIGNLGPVTLTDGASLTGQDVILPKAHGIPDGTTIAPALPPIDGVPMINWATSVLLTHKGCAGSTATYQVFVNGVVERSGSMAEAPAGIYSVTLAPFHPVHGNIQLVINIVCPNGSQPPPVNFNIWIDPSGFVVNTFGRPVAGAKVTLYRADAAAGPFEPVTSGNAIMSPANRLNPMNTDSTGRFGWDVIAGYYRVRAEKSGCTAPNSTENFKETPVLTIPPPVTDLRIVLDCGGSAVFLPTVRR